MTDEKPRVIIIPPKPELQQTAAVTKQLRVAAYCRVSTKEEEQASSYEAQCEYYTDKIMSNKEWTMAGIFADEGITGTSTKKRTEFLRMIRQCKQKKIDLILTKSIQRFASNTLDCINYTRILRQLGIGVLFEKENINSLQPDSEFMITMYGAMAQSESESISGNIRRGRQMHAKVGTLKVPCHWLYGYKKDADGKFCIIPEQAEVVREIYERYEGGASLRNLKDWLEGNQIKTVLGTSRLVDLRYQRHPDKRKILRRCAAAKDFLHRCDQQEDRQKCRPDDAVLYAGSPRSHRQSRAVQCSKSRNGKTKCPSQLIQTGRNRPVLLHQQVRSIRPTVLRRMRHALSPQNAKYQGETFITNGAVSAVWITAQKYCHESPTLREIPLQNAILAAINSVMSGKPALLDRIKNAVSLELLPVQGQTMSLADIERRLAQLDEQFQRLLAEAIDAEDKEACNAQFAEILAEQTALKKQKETILQGSADADRVSTRMKQAEQAVENAAQTITEWNENAVRQIVERVTVLSTDEILVQIKGGAEIKQRLER